MEQETLLKDEDVFTDWQSVRDEFNLSPEYIHLGSSQFISSHPRMVREAVDRHRKELDANPVKYLQDNNERLMTEVRTAAANYLLSVPSNIALTENTTVGLGILYNGLQLDSGDEILSTYHEHYSHFESIRCSCERSGARYRRISLYDD